MLPVPEKGFSGISSTEQIFAGQGLSMFFWLKTRNNQPGSAWEPTVLACSFQGGHKGTEIELLLFILRQEPPPAKNWVLCLGSCLNLALSSISATAGAACNPLVP